MSTDTTTTADEMKTAEIGRVNESGQLVNAAPAPANPARADTAAAQTAGTAGSARATTARATTPRTELPRTASSLPLLGLLGGLTLGAGLMVRRARRRLQDAA
jgi:hypothetical protein